MGYIVACSIRVARTFASLPPVTEPGILAVLDECQARLRVKKPLAVVETSAVHGPALYGLFRPRLVLPSEFGAKFSARELRFVFLHELAHLKRRDLPLSWLIAVLQAVHWFNPLLWLGFARWRADRELACDAMALQAAGPDQNTEYGRTILRLLDAYTRPAAAPVLVGILENKSQLRRRIRMIADYTPNRRLSAVAVVLLIGLAVAGLTDAANRSPTEPVFKPAEAVKTSTASKADVKTPSRPIITSGRTVKVTVVDAESGKPLAGAYVYAPSHAAFFGGLENAPRWKTDAHGDAFIRLGDVPAERLRQNTWFTISAKCDGQTAQGLSFSAENEDARPTVPNEVTLRLRPGITGGGVVQDGSGVPVSGVKLTVYGTAYNYVRARNGREQYSECWTSLDMGPIITDAAGRWVMSDFPKDLEAVVILAGLPDGSTRTFVHTSQDQTYVGHTEGEPLDVEALRAGKSVLRLRSGYSITGTVVDPTGTPLPGVLIKEGYGLVNQKSGGEFRTDSQGHFKIENRPGRQLILGAYSDAFAITSTVVDVGPNTSPVRLQMDPLRPLSIRVLDGDSRPIPGAKIQLVGHKTEGQVLSLDAVTGAQGEFVWTNAPRNAFTLRASRPEATGSGARVEQMIKVAPDQGQVTFRLRAGMEKELIVRGKARDAKTGQPVVMKSVDFQNADRDGFSRFAELNGSDFELSIPATKFRQGMEPAYKLRFEADGHQPFVTSWRDYLEGDWDTEVIFQPGPYPGGIVLLPGGKPAAGAQVAVLTREHLSLFFYSPNQPPRDWAQVVRTDERGAFNVNDPGANLAAIVMDREGFLATTVDQLRTRPQLMLQPWGRVEGVAYAGRNVLPRARISITGGHGAMNGWRFTFNTDTDGEGRFAFDRVPPGESILYRSAVHEGGGPITEAYQLPVTVRPGEVVEVHHGGQGRPIIGRVEGNVDWSRNDQVLVLKQAAAPPHPSVSDFATIAGFEKARDAYSDVERPNQERAARTYLLQFERDGSFRIDDVPEGTYELRIRVTDSTEDQPVRPWDRGKELASLVREVVVPQISGGRSDEPLDLGVLSLDWKGAPPSSPAVVLKARTLDGQLFDLAALRGKTVVLAFWAAWSDRCLEELAGLQKLRSELAKDARIAFWSVSVDDDLDLVRRTIQSKGYDWGQARVEGADRATVTAALDVNTLPAIFLIDPQGQAIGRDLEGETLRSAVRRSLARQQGR
jgi:protocatechuate 3,4-dioxygenase beta subunit